MDVSTCMHVLHSDVLKDCPTFILHAALAAKHITLTVVKFNQTSVHTDIRAEFHCVGVCVQAESAALALVAGGSCQLCFSFSFNF